MPVRVLGLAHGQRCGPGYDKYFHASRWWARPLRPKLGRAQAVGQNFSTVSLCPGCPHALACNVRAGVLGVGTADSKVALFESDDGERGLLCTGSLRQGDLVFEVPLRLALTDHPDDAESNDLLYEVRLCAVGCQLLRKWLRT